MLGKKKRPLDANELYDYAIRLLGGRALSSGEVREKLRQRAAQPLDADAAMAKLKEYGFLDDERFAENFAAARRDTQGFGRFRVTQDLRKRRIAPAVAGKATTDAFAEVDEAEHARRFLERKYRGKDPAQFFSEDKNLASAYRRLRVAGFGSSIAIRVLKEYAKSAVDLESLENEEPIE
jgi:regulatory protein